MNKHLSAMRATIAALALGALAATAATATAPDRSHDAGVGRNIQTFTAIVKALELNYVDSLKSDDPFDNAIAVMLNSIDPYTEYIKPEEQQGFKSMTTGEYGGIGSYIMERGGWTYISGPYEGSPAQKAGLLAGDKIVRIDTTDLRGVASDHVSALLKGQAGSTVRVTVERPYVGADSVLTFDIERGKLLLPSVPYYGVTRDGIGYIKLTSFMERSADEVRRALEAFKADPAVKGVVLDLRDNGGGLLESAVEIVNLFVPKNTEVLRTRGRNGENEKIYTTTKQPLMPDMPLAVLIDGGSASASEITAGALQDLDRAVLIGSRSFGKGLVQATLPMPYDGLLKLTIAKYYIPSGRLIQALDYSHRNADGSVARTPDSLTNEYTTAHGRKVRDGGGLMPDIKMEWPVPSSLTISLMRNWHVFDFASHWLANHPEVAAPEDFEITDEIYADFKEFVRPDSLKYDRVCDDLTDRLRKAAEKEGYLDARAAATLDSLAVMLRHDAGRDLDTHRSEIAPYIASEIMRRRYFSRGEIIEQLKTDAAVDTAAAVLRSPQRMADILGRTTKKQKR